MKEKLYSDEFVKKVEEAFADYPEIIKLVKEQDWGAGLKMDRASAIQYMTPDKILEFGDLESIKHEANMMIQRKELNDQWWKEHRSEYLDLAYPEED